MSLTPLNTTTNANKRAAKGKITLALIGLLIAILVANFAIYNYETHLATAEKVLLELAPVDPRGMMQGDYMALDYAISDQIMEAIETEQKAKGERADSNKSYNLNQEGLAIIKKDSQGVGHFMRLAESSEDNDSHIVLAKDEMLLYYRIRDDQLKLATNAFFFQEGHAEVYEEAKYGLFKVNEQGKPLLTHMVDAEFKVIDPANN